MMLMHVGKQYNMCVCVIFAWPSPTNSDAVGALVCSTQTTTSGNTEGPWVTETDPCPLSKVLMVSHTRDLRRT